MPTALRTLRYIIIAVLTYRCVYILVKRQISETRFAVEPSQDTGNRGETSINYDSTRGEEGREEQTPGNEGKSGEMRDRERRSEERERKVRVS